MPTDDVPLPLGMKLLVGAVVCGGLVVWGLMACRAWRRQPVLPHEPRRPVPWGANALATILLFWLLGLLAGSWLANRVTGQPTGPLTVAAHYAISAVGLATFIFGICVTKYQAAASLADLGLDASRLAHDIGVGVAAFLASIVPLFGLETLLERLVKYDHPLVESVRAHPDTAMFVSATIAAVVAAPIFEEFLFRVLLQGWFEALEARRRDARGISPTAGPSWWPIALSALLFAMMHLGNGAAPIPLFFFAVVLGYLYQRTHRLWPSLVTHLLLNAGSMLILWSQFRHAAT
jgi:membrane protease YdiL (CAAX protease family)